MKHLLILPILSIATAAWAEVTQITIRVKMHLKQTEAPRAFSAVDGFQVYRGSTKFDAASCPDASDRDGKLFCSITCSATDAVEKTLRLVPPGKTARVKGYVAPAAEELKLSKCKVQPKSQWEFVYTDPVVSVAQIVAKEPKLAAVARAQPENNLLVFNSSAEAIAVLEKVGETAQGREALFNFQQAALAATESQEIKLDPKAREAVEKYPSVIGSIYFKTLVMRVKPDAAKYVTIKADKSAYFSNMEAVAMHLDRDAAKSPQVNQLLNQVQEWKAVPASASTRNLLGSLK
jgi:hypothetical protein